MTTQAARQDATVWQVYRRWALSAGAGGLLLCVLGWWLDPPKFFFAYLAAFDFYLALGLGALAIWMLHNLTGGAWGRLIRRPLEAATRTLPLLALLFVPIALGLSQLYEWADPSEVHDHHLREVLEKKHDYLNVPFFLGRTVFYFAVWLLLTLLLNWWSALQERSPDPARSWRIRAFSALGLILYVLTMTFAAVDWLMSLEPEWYSTIFGILVVSGQLQPAMGFAILAAVWLGPRSPAESEAWIDVGNLLLASVMVWAYMSFSQLLLVWSGNLPEEITWYLARSEGGWQWVAVLLAVGNFALPFVLLLARANKRDPRRLLRIAAAVVAMNAVCQFWLVAPVYAQRFLLGDSKGQLYVHWVDLAAYVGLGGLWLTVFLWQLQARPLTLPPDPYVEEAPHYA